MGSQSQRWRWLLCIFLSGKGVWAEELPGGARKVQTVEGVTEYAYPNGLHALLIPDSSQPQITVNVTYRVGSRNEAYGETGMAHLLEHMVFKKAKSGREIFKELSDKAGGFFNGTTNYDQTMYFESFTASDANLRWALDLETDRMTNMTMLKQDLATEMTVVRNEMEAGENSPENVLEERVLAAAYNFHNYGKTVIGARSDVERVPIENLAAFYKKYYQPDNAVLVVAGKIDEAQTLGMIAQTLASLAKPDRVLTQPYTVEPTQEGERQVTLRRVGNTQDVMVVYHVPSAMHPDATALQVLGELLSAEETGRLYKDLVETKKAVRELFYMPPMHDPGYVIGMVTLKTDQSIDDAAQILLKEVEGLSTNPPTAEEVDRAKQNIQRAFELGMNQSQNVALMVGSAAATGDWRLMFLRRDEVSKITPADVARVAKAYLKSSNRTLGEFIPTATPDRAEIAAAPEVTERFKDFKGGAAVQEGETIDPTQKNLETRLQRSTLPNGMKLVLFPKKTRGEEVIFTMAFRFGDEKSLFGQKTTAQLFGSTLMSGTKDKNSQQIQNEMTRLKAYVNLWGGAGYGAARSRSTAKNFPEVLQFVRELLRDATFPEAEFEKARLERIAGVEQGKSEPASLATLDMNRQMNAQYPRGDIRAVSTPEERIAALKSAKVESVRDFYKEYFAPAEGEIVVIGQFDPEQVKKEITKLFGDWKSAKHYARIGNAYTKVEAINHAIETPDKQNAFFIAETPIKLKDEDPEYPALLMGASILGNGANSRLFLRIRVKDGLSYGAGANLTVVTKEDGSNLTASAIAAPQNMPKVEADFKEEIARLLKDGVTEEELKAAKKAWLDERLLERGSDGALIDVVNDLERWGRTLGWSAELESKVAALTPQQVNDALRRAIDPTTFSIVKAGDFKKVNVFQK